MQGRPKSRLIFLIFFLEHMTQTTDCTSSIARMKERTYFSNTLYSSTEFSNIF